MRWAHIFAAVTAAGSTFFMRWALLPSLDSIDEASRAKLHQAIRARWVLPLHLSITFLLVSGLYNFMMIMKTYQLEKFYHPLFGIKFLLALAVFFIAIQLIGKSAAAQKFQQNRRLWLNVNVVLMVGIILISGVLRQSVKTPKLEQPAAVAPAAEQS
jgi:uncharacterized membrane protein